MKLPKALKLKNEPTMREKVERLYALENNLMHGAPPPEEANKMKMELKRLQKEIDEALEARRKVESM